MGNTAYIATNLDCAFFVENGMPVLVPGKSKEAPENIDGYSLSQMFAANPEIIEATWSSIEELQSQVATEYQRQEALSMALELMDTSLSENYRSGIASLLNTELDANPGLLTFLQNRFLATPVPAGFDPKAAKKITDDVSINLAALYENLEEKTELFAAFYTLLVHQLNLEPAEQEFVDLKLTDNGSYAAFATALYERSQLKYIEATKIAEPVLNQMQVFKNADLFDKVQEKIREIHHVKLTLPGTVPAKHLIQAKEQRYHRKNAVLHDSHLQEVGHINFDLPKHKSSIIKVLGVGGGGSNSVSYMFTQDVNNVDFIICNTDVKALEQSRVPNKIQLGPQLTQGLGAGANPEVGKQATEESLEEIRRILEVNTKMAFITAGMGGGTGTGGAPIIGKICRDLGILTVGIVTTPFGFEGPRRLKQAEEGIRQLQPFVDTLLVISNDKLRIQYGDLKMKDAFSKADNVIATAAKCVTDIINSRGHIIVDFADVCTVMKNGGVAILGSSAVEGENRAQRAIEEALNSPLLNDNEIFGAKWILINIISAEGDHECTMDELEIINHYLRTQAGENTDVIVGMGYDSTLDKKIGITLIATGFDHKSPFAKPERVVERPVELKEEKIVMMLGVAGEEKKMSNNRLPLLFEDKDTHTPHIVAVTETHVAPAVVTEDGPKSVISDEEESRRRAIERINKLRNISFNMGTHHDTTGEFDNIPAYVRRNMELFGNTLTSAEDFYSKYTVKKEENNPQAQISTINKFLDEGKKPD